MVAAKLIDGPEGRQKIDRYELVAEIASGGMATVFLARVSGIGGFRRFVAIKRLHPHLANEGEFVQMFLDEARLAAGIHHPHVVPILEVGASDRGYYLVMDYLEGDTLARLLARAATSGKKIPQTIGLRILLDTLHGLHAAHELRDEQDDLVGLVHRDVSPQNVLVGVDGIARITDFGVARAATRLTATRVGQLKGKIAYMAPEQATGASEVDRRADVFSAGIVLWEVLAARRLFKAENEAATLSRVISEPIPKLTQVNSEVNSQLAAVCMKALERDPEKRFATCALFADALERVGVAVGKIAAPRDLSAYVTEVIGDEIAQQREAVRAWLARSEPSQVGIPDLPKAKTSSRPPGAPEGSYPTASGISPATRTPQPSLAPTRMPLVLAGLAGAVLLVVGIVLFASRGEPQQALPTTATEAPAANAAAGPAPDDPAAAPSPASASATAPAASAAAPSPGTVSAIEELEPEPVVKKPLKQRASSGRSRATPAPSKPEPKVDEVDLTNPYR